MRKPFVLVVACLSFVAASRADVVTTPTFRISGILPPAADSNGPSELHTGGARNITTDGRTVVFHSHASNLVAGDSGGQADVFQWSRTDGVIRRVTALSGGVQPNGPSLWPSISDTGRIVFESMASNLVPGDANNARDVFVRDGAGGAITRVSVSSTGTDSNEPAWSSATSGSSISGNGRFVVFTSRATNLVVGDANGRQDVFMRDTCVGAPPGCTASTTLISAGPGGIPGNSDSSIPTISSDGRFIAFQSYASNLTTCDTLPINCSYNGQQNIFVLDRSLGIVVRASWATGTGGFPPNAASANPQISSNGRYVVFESLAQSLSPEDQDSKSDIFVRDLQMNSTMRISNRAPSAQFTENPSEPDEAHFPSISNDGRYVAYSAGQPLASNIRQHVYVWDRNRGTPVRIPAEPVIAYKNAYGVSPAAPLPPFATGAYPSIAGNGSAVVFVSEDPRIDPADFNNSQDVFLRTFACADCTS